MVSSTRMYIVVLGIGILTPHINTSIYQKIPIPKKDTMQELKTKNTHLCPHFSGLSEIEDRGVRWDIKRAPSKVFLVSVHSMNMVGTYQIRLQH